MLHLFFLDLMKLKYKHESLKTLKDIPEWEILKFKQRSEDLPCLIHVIDDDPDAFKGLNLHQYIRYLLFWPHFHNKF